jgi:hypothetical protein
MNKNVASQKITLLAIDTSTNAPKTGDAANLTAYVSKDDGAVTVLADTSAAEKDATNAPGLYDFDVAQAETNADKLVFSGKSGTANVKLVPVTVYTRPANASALSVNASGHVTLADASLVTAKLGTFALAKTTNITGFNDIAATAIVSSGAITTSAGAVTNVTNVSQVTGNVLGDVDGSVGAVGTGGINANSFTAGALNAAALATDAVNEIAAAILVTPANKIATDTEGRVSVESNDVQMDEDGYLLVKRHDGTELPTQTSVDTIDNLLDTEVAAIKAKTDQLTSFDFVTAGTRFLTMIEVDGPVYRFTDDALEEAPAGGGGGGDATAENQGKILTILQSQGRD